MKKIGVFGTCRIDDFSFDDFIKKTTAYPYIFKNSNCTINVRPLGYTTTSSDVLQNLRLIHDKTYMKIKDKFVLHNVFHKHGGKSFIPDIGYDCVILEICSIKKIIHRNSELIFPYEIERVCADSSEYSYESEEFSETVDNIIAIQKLLNCKIILIPPIYTFDGSPEIGCHENISISSKVIQYRMDILDRLRSASDGNDIILFDWNVNIKKHGVATMLTDQFHFSEWGKKYNLKQILDIFESKTVSYPDEDVSFRIPKNNSSLHRYYQMIETRGDCEKYFRILVKYMYDKSFLDKSKNMIDLGAWIGDNTIPWAINIPGTVFAIDPSTDNIKYIDELVYLNNTPNVETICRCISDTNGYAYTTGDIKHAEFNAKGGSIRVETTTLDALYHNKLIDNIGFMHLDVEGYEQNVLDGSLDVLRRFRPVVVWENHLRTDDFNKTNAFFRELKYESFIINELFPHCRPDCRNFISFPTANPDMISDINIFFSITENKPNPDKLFLIHI